ncbi:MAG: hypothetical protein ACM3Q1_10455 [Bacteroidales bacterium]
MKIVSMLLPGARGLRLWLCLAVLAGGLLARTWGIADSGIVDDDMAYYAIFGEYYRKLLFAGYPMYFGLDIAYKPGFLSLSFLASLIFGYSEYMLPLANAFVATGVSLAVYRLAQLLTKDEWTPVVAMAAVTFVPFLIRLDRMGLSHTSATLLLLLSIHQLVLWARYSWEGPRSVLRRAALLLGGAFLFHPTVLIYCFTLGAVVCGHALAQRARPFVDRLKSPLYFAAWAFVPLLLVDVVYRTLFWAFPRLIAGRAPNFLSPGYLGDVLTGFAMASVSGEGSQDKAFAWKGLHLFGNGVTDYVCAAAILAGIGLLLWRMWRRERVWAYLFVATVPLLMMAFNPYVGQYARALHATLPMLLIAAAAALCRLVEAIPAVRRSRTAVLGGMVVVLSIAQASSFARQGQFDNPAKQAELALPQHLLGALKAAGAERTYIYYSGFYGLHWFFYVNKYFGAIPFILQNGGLEPPADYRMILTPAELEQKVRDGVAEVVLIRRMDERTARAWNGHGKEDEFVALAAKLAGRRLERVGEYTVPANVEVFDFRQARMSAQ